MTLVLTINNSADHGYFNWWIQQNYSSKFLSLTSDGTNITLEFSESLDASEQTDITDTYNNLSEADKLEDKYCAIYDYFYTESRDKRVPPYEVDYNKALNKRLHPIITDIYKG